MPAGTGMTGERTHAIPRYTVPFSHETGAMPKQSATTATSRFRPSIWRVVTWLLLLLTVFGIFQYSAQVWHVGAALHHADRAEAQDALTRMMVWNVAYLAGACITLVATAGVLFRRSWARPALRVVAALLALWLLVTAIMMGAHLASFNHHSSMLLAQSDLGEAGRAMLARVRRAYLVGIVLKAVAVPILVWLAWRLGVPSVRAQFPASPARKAR